jgi:hypothetical protein
MKIVFLNSQLHGSPIVAAMRNAGAAVIVCDAINEADQVLKLHGRTLSLFIGFDDLGIEFARQLKENSEFSSLPTILVHSKWTAQQCAQHQQSALSANAYLRPGFDARKLINTINQILGTSLSVEEAMTTEEVQPQVQSSDNSTLSGLDLAKVLSDGPISVGNDTPIEVDASTRMFSLTSQLESPPSVQSHQSESSDAPVFDLGGSITPSDHEAPLDFTRVQMATPKDDLAEPAFMPELAQTFASPLAPSHTEIPVQAHTNAQTQTSSPSPALETDVDQDALQSMPYLAKRSFQSPLAYQQPLNDAIIPGGATDTPDLETLKRYLLLREQDVAALSQQLKQSKDQIAHLDETLRQERAINTEFAHLAQEQGNRIDQFEIEKQAAVESVQSEVEELKFEMKKRADKVRLMEMQVREASGETERLKERVRVDIRKIRTREKELENRLEIMKKDSEALLTAREQKIIELKRKLDLLEFNMDLLQDQFEKEKTHSAQLKEKLLKAAQVVRVAGGLLHPHEQVDLTDLLPESTESEDKTSAA